MDVSYIIDKGNGDINLYLDGNPYTVGKPHLNYSEVMERVRTNNFDDIEKLVDIPAQIRNAAKGELVIDDGAIYYNGAELHNVMVDRIFQFIKEDFPIERLVKFLENALLNPNSVAVNELYLFLENSNLPLTEDGCFLSYKKVRSDYKSFHPNPDGSRYDHHIGAKLEMNREDCDERRNETCSRGLHFCSFKYLSKFNYRQGRVVILKINPKDVVTIPNDYNNAKGRACYYEVIAEYDSEERETVHVLNAPSINTDKIDIQDVVTVGDYGHKPSGQRFYQVRGAGGKFVKKTTS